MDSTKTGRSLVISNICQTKDLKRATSVTPSSQVINNAAVQQRSSNDFDNDKTRYIVSKNVGDGEKRGQEAESCKWASRIVYLVGKNE